MLWSRDRLFDSWSGYGLHNKVHFFCFL
jgi:hypothetical protein